MTSPPLTRLGLTAATMFPVVAAIPRFQGLVTTDDTSYCALRNTVGLLCPGCGMTHAMIELSHGAFIDATRANALVWLYLALVGIGWLTVMRPGMPTSPRTATWIATSLNPIRANASWMVLSTIAIFTLVRNL